MAPPGLGGLWIRTNKNCNGPQSLKIGASKEENVVLASKILSVNTCQTTTMTTYPGLIKAMIIRGHSSISWAPSAVCC